MFRKAFFAIFACLGIILSAACGAVGDTNLAESSNPEANMANPASVFCEENGGTLEIRTDASGGQVGFCIFPDGSECEEWSYFRGECTPGASLLPEETEVISTPTMEHRRSRHLCW